MITQLSERLDLYAQGYCEISLYSEHYPVHKAIFENNLPIIRRICVGER